MTWRNPTPQRLYNQYINKFPGIAEYWRIPPNMKVRVVGKKTVPKILDFYTENDFEAASIFADILPYDLELAAFFKRVEQKIDVPIVILEGNEIVGAMFILDSGKPGVPHCTWICTHKSRRNLGLAICLYLAAFKYIAEEKHEPVTYFVTNDPKLRERLKKVFNAREEGDVYIIELE